MDHPAALWVEHDHHFHFYRSDLQSVPPAGARTDLYVFHVQYNRVFREFHFLQSFRRRQGGGDKAVEVIKCRMNSII